MDALSFYASCKPSEIKFLSVVMILSRKIFIMPSKEPRAFLCHKDAPDHYSLLCGMRADSLPDAICLLFVLLGITVSNTVILW